MRILYAAFSYPPNVGGGELHLHELARRLQQAGDDVSVVTQAARPFEDVLAAARRPEPPGCDVWEGVPVRRIGLSPGRARRMAPWAWAHRRGGRIGALASRRLTALLAPAWRRAAPDADVVHAVRMGYGFLVANALAHARAHGRPFVFTRMRHDVERDPQRACYDRVARAADAVIALTDHEREHLVGALGIAPERIHVTGVGPVLAERADVAGFRRRHAIDAPYVLFLGRQMPAKGLDVLLDAMPHVWRERPEVHLLVVGPRTSHGRRLLAQHRDRRVHDLGPVDLLEKTAALAGCELLALPSRKESFGGVLTEAWSLGRPVVAGRLPALASVVDDGATGVLAEVAAAPWADAMLELLRSPVRARALGAAGRDAVARRWSWERIAGRTRSVYARLA